MNTSPSRWRPLLVLGVDRSGTSLVAELLSLWGAHGGNSEELAKGDIGNPHGYFEYAPMQYFVSDLIASVGCTAWDPNFKTLMQRQAKDHPELRRKALKLVAKMEHPDRPWFWKEPDFVFSLPFWTEILADPVYLITLRNPCDSAASYKRFFVPPALSDKLEVTVYFFLRWQYCMMMILERLKSYRHKLVVPYESLVSAPQEQCERICRYLAAQYAPAAPFDPEKVARMAQAVSPDLWRNNGGKPFAASSATEQQKELYAYLASHLDGDFDDFDATRYPFPPFAEEYMSNMSVMRWLLQYI